MSDLITVVNMIPKLSSGETNQDSEPNLAVNPVNPLEMAGTAFTPSPSVGSNSPIFYSNDGGNTWSLIDIIAGTPVRDQTLRFASTSGTLYAGVLWGTGNNIAFINFDILRTNDFSGLNVMTRLARRQNDDQPFIQAATVPSGPGAGKDRIYVGSNDHAPSNIPSTIDLSLDAAASSPTTSTVRLEARTVIRDGYQTRPAIHPNGTVYALFYALVGPSCDVVIVRDDNWASSATPFQALVDTVDLKQGVRIVTGVNNPFNSLFIGQQRIGGDLSIAVDPNDSATVYVCYGNLQGGTYTLHVVKSTDSGATWSADLRTVTNATNPALAINSKGRLGFLYQQVTGSTPNQRWVTTLELTHSDFASITTHFLANTPAATPVKGPDPYLGDYLYMMTVGQAFYGIFSANNTPDKANFPNNVAYQRNANFSTKTLLAVDNVTPVSVSIDPFFFKVAPKAGSVATAIANSGSFGNVCLGSFVDELLTINNNGSGPLLISAITSSSADFLPPSVLSYPLEVGPGDSIDVIIRFQPTGAGPHFATITITSNDPASPHKVAVSGVGQTPRLNLAIANSGNFGRVCIGSFADEPLILNNGSKCALSILSVTSSSAEFLVPLVLSYPLIVGGGDSLPLPIRFAPTSFGPKAAIITVTGNDPAGTHKIDVSGDAPSGKLAVTGSTCIGGVKACCRAERTISICNVGDCALHVTSVAFKRKSRHWKLINNPFPATLHPGSCLGLVIRYKATEKCPVACELVITSDDPVTPVKTLDMLAYTIWNQCGCKQCCDDCRKGCCDKCHTECCEGGADDCCEDEDEDDD
jgi:ASPM-SPD-2-Hydin domain-containing protein